jgi:hypothetical protein
MLRHPEEEDESGNDDNSAADSDHAAEGTGGSANCQANYQLQIIHRDPPKAIASLRIPSHFKIDDVQDCVEALPKAARSPG